MKKIKFTILFAVLILGMTFTYAQNAYIKVSLADCTNCYQGISLIQTNLLPHIDNVCYVFESKFIEDSVSLVDRFNIQPKIASVIFSDSVYRSIGKDNFSELIVRIKNRTYTNLIKNITKEEIIKILESLNAKQPVAYPMKLPPSFSLVAQGSDIIVKNMADNSYTLYIQGQNVHTLKANSDTIYTQLFKQFPAMKDGNDYIKIARENIALKPQINYVLKNIDSTFTAFINVFMVDRINGTTNDTLMKKVLLIARSNGLKFKFYQLDDSAIVCAGNNINEYNNIFMNKNQLTVGINRQDGEADSATHFLATYIYDSKLDRFSFKKIESFVVPLNYLKNHESFTNTHIIADNDYFVLPFSNRIFHKPTSRTFDLPFSEAILLNKNPARVTFGIWDLKNINEKIYMIYSIKTDLFIGEFNTNSSKFTSIAIKDNFAGMPVLSTINNELYLVGYDRDAQLLKFNKQVF